MVFDKNTQKRKENFIQFQCNSQSEFGFFELGSIRTKCRMWNTFCTRKIVTLYNLHEPFIYIKYGWKLDVLWSTDTEFYMEIILRSLMKLASDIGNFKIDIFLRWASLVNKNVLITNYSKLHVRTWYLFDGI